MTIEIFYNLNITIMIIEEEGENSDDEAAGQIEERNYRMASKYFII